MTDRAPVEHPLLREGFRGQRMSVLPAPRVRLALANPATAPLTVTDCGYFPTARFHGRARPRGIPQLVALICVRGAGWCRAGLAAASAVGPGDIALLPPDSPHEYAAADDDPWTIWWLHVQGSQVPGLLAMLGVGQGHSVRRLADPTRVASLASEVIRWHGRDTTDRSLIAASGAASHLLGLVAAESEVEHGTQAAVESAIEHLRANLAGRTSVAELAAMVGLSRSHFAVLFKQRTGLAVLQFQTQLRMQRARELLDTTDAAIEHIAATVGYDDPFYFARQFKRVHSVTARQYRRHEKG